jgi:hypothetical protein
MRVRLTTLAVGKAKSKSITYSVCVCVCILALVIQHVMRLRYIVICGLSGSK